MVGSAVRRRCRGQLDQLRAKGFEIPRPFDVDEVCGRVGACLGRPIVPVAIDMPAGAPYGLTFFTDERLIVAYERSTTPVHRDHIVAHEIAHIVFEHETTVVPDQDAIGRLLPSLRPGLIRRVLGRTGAYDEVAEQEAETLATMLLEEASRPAPHEPERAMGAADQELYRRLRRTFEHPDR